MEKKNISRFVATALAASILTPAQTFAASFSDITGFWGEAVIERMTADELFSGFPDGTFRPERTMTRAEFLVPLVNTLLENEVLELYVNDPEESVETTGNWYDLYYLTAEAYQLLPESFTIKGVETPITRQEMAYIMVEAATLQKEIIPMHLVNHQWLSDYDQISSGYRVAIRTAYTMGLLRGNESGNINPQGEATRGEAAQVLYNFVYPEARPAFDYLMTYAPVDSPLAKVGDIVLDGKGNEVVLAYGKSGVLGEGQGVAPDLGVPLGYGRGEIQAGMSATATEAMSLTDSLGNALIGQRYDVNPFTNEGHWQKEWDAILKSVTSKPTAEGDYLYQISLDLNWYWDKDWVLLGTNSTEEVVTAIREANRLY